MRKPLLQADQALYFAARSARTSIMFTKAERETKVKNRKGMDMNEEFGLTPYETREILFYKTDNGEVRVEILLYQENLWLTQAKMAELFEVQKAAISKHLKNITTLSITFINLSRVVGIIASMKSNTKSIATET